MSLKATAPLANASAVRGFVPPQNDTERFLMRHIEDIATLASRRGLARYSDFLNDREQLLACAALQKVPEILPFVHFEGGIEQAERKVLCIEPYGCTPVSPVRCMQVSVDAFARAKALQHKDYLGSLMGLSISRACIGDIILPHDAPGTAYIFVLATVLPMLLDEVCTIGSVNVHVCEQDCLELPDFLSKERVMQSTTVSSLRIDAVLAAMARCSRGMAAEWIAAGRVEINHVATNSAHASVYEKDIFTVRGKGRFQLVTIQGKSKKNRIIIEYFQF